MNLRQNKDQISKLEKEIKENKVKQSALDRTLTVLECVKIGFDDDDSIAEIKKLHKCKLGKFHNINIKIKNCTV